MKIGQMSICKPYISVLLYKIGFAIGSWVDDIIVASRRLIVISDVKKILEATICLEAII